MSREDLDAERRAKSLAELIERLGRAAHMRCFHANLNPAQWAALRFLSRANRSVRTVTGFARANGTTHGTATQTVGALVRKGLIARAVDVDDRRVIRLDLTSEGRAILQRDPLNELVRTLRTLSAERSRSFARELAELNQKFSTLAAADDTKAFDAAASDQSAVQQ